MSNVIQTSQPTRVAIVVLNWNGKEMTQRCIESLQKQKDTSSRIILVDNGSVDGSVETILHEYPFVDLVSLPENTGFATGTNVGIRHALFYPDVTHVFTLNNDTELYPDTIAQLVSVIDAHPGVGAVAAKMVYFDNESIIDSVGILTHSDGGGLSRGNRQPDTGQYDQVEEVFGACGGAGLYSRAMVEDIWHEGSLFDDTYFAYYEDLDVAWRAQLRGWKTMTAPQARVKHIHSATTKSYSPFKAYHVNRNRFFVILKDFPLLYMVKALLMTPFRYLRLVNSVRIKKGPSHELAKRSGRLKPALIVLKGWGSVLLHLPEMLVKRRQIQRTRKISNQEIQTLLERFSATTTDMIYK